VSNPLFYCPICGAAFNTIEEYQLHLETQHPEAGYVPPEFNEYEWYVDPQVGYWSPMLKEWGVTTIKQEAEKEKEQIKTGVGAIPSISSEGREVTESVPERLDPDEVRRNLMMRANIVDLDSTAIFTATSLIAALPFTRVADAIDEIWRIPVIASAVDSARDARYSVYSYAWKPYLVRSLYRQATPLIPEPYRLALAASKGLLDDEKYKMAMAENGLDEFWAEMWKQENYTYPTLSQIFEMLWRGLIDEETAKTYLIRQGMLENVVDQLLGLKDVIPPLDDLIRFAVREAFPVEPGRAQFEEMKKWASKKGLSDYWVDRYWLAHFNRMPLTQAYENLWRGYFDEDDFKRYLLLADVHPDDWDAILRVAYRPPTLRELGYGYDVGVYSKEDIERYRRMEGLSPEDAKLAAESMVAYRTEAEREALRREYMYLFAYGRITEDEFREHLKRLITSDEAVELWVERGKIYRERIQKYPVPEESVAITASEAKWAFQHGLKDEVWLRETLKNLGWTEERIDLYIRRAKIEMMPEEEEEKPVEYRKLTISQIADLYRHGKISKVEIPTALVNIGYSPEDAEKLAQIIIEVVDSERKPKTLTKSELTALYDVGIFTRQDIIDGLMKLGYDRWSAEMLSLYEVMRIRYPDLRAMYSKGWITADELYSELVDLGLPVERARELTMMTVKYTKQERTATERDLTKTEILKGAKMGIITPEQAMNLLMDLGYDEGEAAYLLVLNKVVSAGDPEGYWDMKKVTEMYKRAVGKKWKEVPDELIVLEQQIKMMREEIQKMREEGAPEDQIISKELTLNELEVRYRQLAREWGKKQ